MSRSKEQKHDHSRHTVAIGTHLTGFGRASCPDIRLTNAGHQASSRKQKAKYDPDEEEEKEDKEGEGERESEEYSDDEAETKSDV